MNRPSLQDLYGRLVARRPRPSREGCMAPEALLAIAEGRASERERLDTLRHVGACGQCRAELDQLRSAVAAGRGLGRRRVRGPAIAASLVVLIAAATVWRARLEPRPGSQTLVGRGSEVALVAPIGEMPAGTRAVLTWHPLLGARQYEVELADASGHVLFSQTTRDTAATVPERAGTVPGVEYAWWVQAVLADGTAPRSRTARFRLGRLP